MKRLALAKKEKEKHVAAFEEFSQAQSKHVCTWEKMVEDYESNRVKNANPYKRSEECAFLVHNSVYRY